MPGVCCIYIAHGATHQLCTKNLWTATIFLSPVSMLLWGRFPWGRWVWWSGGRTDEHVGPGQASWWRNLPFHSHKGLFCCRSKAWLYNHMFEVCEWHAVCEYQDACTCSRSVSGIAICPQQEKCQDGKLFSRERHSLPRLAWGLSTVPSDICKWLARTEAIEIHRTIQNIFWVPQNSSKFQCFSFCPGWPSANIFSARRRRHEHMCALIYWAGRDAGFIGTWGHVHSN